MTNYTPEERRELYAIEKGFLATEYNIAYYDDDWVHYQALSWPDGYCTFRAFPFTGTRLEAMRRAEKDLRAQQHYGYREAYKQAWEYATERLGLS